MVNGNVLTGHSLLHLTLTPGQILWGLVVNLRKKIGCLGLRAPVISGADFNFLTACL